MKDVLFAAIAAIDAGNIERARFLLEAGANRMDARNSPYPWATMWKGHSFKLGTKNLAAARKMARDRGDHTGRYFTVLQDDDGTLWVERVE